MVKVFIFARNQFIFMHIYLPYMFLYGAHTSNSSVPSAFKTQWYKNSVFESLVWVNDWHFNSFSRISHSCWFRGHLYTEVGASHCSVSLLSWIYKQIIKRCSSLLEAITSFFLTRYSHLGYYRSSCDCFSEVWSVAIQCTIHQK